jgi:hypothetical protein
MISIGDAWIGCMWVGVWWFMAGMLLERILGMKKPKKQGSGARVQGPGKEQKR